MARNTLLTYPDPNETFKFIPMLARFQLGAVISQKGEPIHFYSRKITGFQQWYTSTERELLITAETLKDYITIQIFQILRIYTDHKILHVKL